MGGIEAGRVGEERGVDPSFCGRGCCRAETPVMGEVNQCLGINLGSVLQTDCSSTTFSPKTSFRGSLKFFFSSLFHIICVCECLHPKGARSPQVASVFDRKAKEREREMARWKNGKVKNNNFVMHIFSFNFLSRLRDFKVLFFLSICLSSPSVSHLFPLTL